MLYALHEMQHAALAPMNVFAKASLDLLTSPLNPFAQMPGTRNLAAGTELFLRLTNRYEKPAFGIDSTDVAGQKVAVHEELELDLPFCQLRHFRRDTKVVQPTVLLVAPTRRAASSPMSAARVAASRPISWPSTAASSRSRSTCANPPARR